MKTKLMEELLLAAISVVEKLIERTYKLEERTELQEEKIKVANHRIEDLEKKVDR